MAAHRGAVTCRPRGSSEEPPAPVDVPNAPHPWGCRLAGLGSGKVSQALLQAILRTGGKLRHAAGRLWQGEADYRRRALLGALAGLGAMAYLIRTAPAAIVQAAGNLAASIGWWTVNQAGNVGTAGKLIVGRTTPLTNWYTAAQAEI